MTHWTRRLARLLLTPVLYLAAAVVAWTAFALPVRVDRHLGLLPAGLGFAATLVLFVCGRRFVRLYVFGHELTHWLAAKLFRRRTGRLRVGRHSGSVEVEDPNAIIVLAPYIVPVYTLMVTGAYGVVRFLVEPFPAWGIAGFSAALGSPYAFHLDLTGLSLRYGRQDLRLCGPVFSIGLILLGNLALIFLALVVAGRHWDTALPLLGRHSLTVWSTLVEAGRSVWREAQRWLAGR